MSDSNEENSLEGILQRHRAEKKSLQAKIQHLKKTKTSKKDKKTLSGEIIALENELEARQKLELASLADSKNGEDVVSAPIKRESRAQKRRMKEEAARMQLEEDKRQIRQDANAEYLKSAKFLEQTALNELLTKRSLKIHEVQSNGDCLYSAVLVNDCHYDSVELLREAVSKYMMTHKDDFIHFLSNSNGDAFSDNDYSTYCNDILKCGTWAGQPEIIAISSLISRPIHVIQANGPLLEFGNSSNDVVYLSYHRHLFHLGEHYNALIVDD